MSQLDQWLVGHTSQTQGRAKPLIIGVTGGSASGKTSVCSAIVNSLQLPWVDLLSMDRYYKVLNLDEQKLAHDGLYNFDHPDAFDSDRLYEDILQIKAGNAVEVPNYDFSTHSRTPQTDTIRDIDIIIVEGILLFYHEKVRDLLDLKIYVDTDNDLRLSRRIKRDIIERGRSVDNVLDQYQRTVKPSFEQFIQPTKRFADLIIPWNDTNPVAINLLTQHISAQLSHRRAPVTVANTPSQQQITTNDKNNNNNNNTNIPEKISSSSSQTTTPIHSSTSTITHTSCTPSSRSTLPQSLAAAGVTPDQTCSITPLPPATLEGLGNIGGIESPASSFLPTSTGVILHASPQLISTEGGFLPNSALSLNNTHQTSPATTASISASASNKSHELPNVASASFPHPRTNLISAVKSLQEQHQKQCNPKGKSTRLFNANETCNVYTLHPSPNIIALHTILRDSNTVIDTFRFALNRLVRIVCSEALNFLCYSQSSVQTPTGALFHGLQYDSKHVVCVSIVRAGEAFESAVRDVIQDVAIGKIVIQQNNDNKASSEPRLYYAKLPDLSDPNTKILLFDGVCSTGSAIVMAIKVLLEHNVLPENIIFCCVAAAPEGLYHICTNYPQVKIISSSLEDGLDSQLFSTPGVGYIGDRYYGTMPSTKATVISQDLVTEDELN